MFFGDSNGLGMHNKSVPYLLFFIFELIDVSFGNVLAYIKHLIVFDLFLHLDDLSHYLMLS